MNQRSILKDNRQENQENRFGFGVELPVLKLLEEKKATPYEASLSLTKKKSAQVQLGGFFVQICAAYRAKCGAERGVRLNYFDSDLALLKGLLKFLKSIYFIVHCDFSINYMTEFYFNKCEKR